MVWLSFWLVWTVLVGTVCEVGTCCVAYALLLGEDGRFVVDGVFDGLDVGTSAGGVTVVSRVRSVVDAF
jgi:hypothetical protein